MINLYLPLLVLLTLSIFNSVSHATPKLLDKIIAIVNEDVITKTMLDNRVDDFKKQIDPAQLARIGTEILKKQVLERMVSDTIQSQKAKQFGIKIDDLLLNRMMEQLAQQNKMSLKEFRATVEKQGINFARFREQTRNDLIIKQLQQRAIARKIAVSDQEVERYIIQSEESGALSFHLKHILIALPETSTPEDISKAKQKSESIHQKIKNGERFENLAIKYSNGRNALKGGDLGIRKANELPQQFVDVATKLKPKQTSEPIKSVSGFHLIKLISSSTDVEMVSQNHIRHILIKTGNENSDKKARATLLKLKQKIASGEDFAKLASKYSNDDETKVAGGDFGWTNPGALNSTVEQVANTLSVKQLSEPFKSKFGWHLIQVLGHRQHDISQSNKKTDAKIAIRKRKFAQELRLWLRRIRDEAYVNIIAIDS